MRSTTWIALMLSGIVEIVGDQARFGPE